MNTSNPYDGDRVPGAVGFALPGVSVRVTDPETGKELARETIGMIEVKGPNVFRGYWRMPEKTKAEFRDDGFFITGDLGKIDGKGYVHILGRGKDLVISGGFNVYPKEIESEIDAMPGVIESAVIGVPHADFGEGVTAVLVCNKGADISEASVLKALDGQKVGAKTFVLLPLAQQATVHGLIYADRQLAGSLVLSEKEMALLKTVRNHLLVAMEKRGLLKTG